MSATIKDVSKIAKVSIATVSNVITGKKYVNPETMERVKKSMKELSYVPNVAARALKSNKTYAIGIIVPDITNPFFGEIFKAIQSVIDKSDYQLNLASTDQNVEKEKRVLNSFLRQKIVDAVILVAPRMMPESFPIHPDMPIIIVDRPEFKTCSDISFVYSDNVISSSMIAQYAINAGYEQFACLAGPTNVPNANLRVEGFLSKLKEKGIPEKDVIIYHAEFTFEDGFDSMIKLLATKKRKGRIAVFVCSDIAAWGAMEAVKSSGLKVKEQVGIIGYDDIFFSKFLQPGLSTYQTPVKQMGMTVGTMVLDKLNLNGKVVPKAIEIDGQLKIRQSI